MDLGGRGGVADCPHSWVGRPAYSCRMGKRALCIPLCPPGWLCCSLREWASRDCPENWCSLLHWKSQPHFWNWCVTLCGRWRLTADTGNRQRFFSGHRRRAKRFPGCPSGHVLCLYQTQSFPKPCCLDFLFHFSAFVAGRVEGEQLRPSWIPQSFVLEIHWRNLCPELLQLPFTSYSTISLAIYPHRLIPGGTSHLLLEHAATQGLFPSICSHQPYSEPVSRAVSAPPICLWIKKPNYKWEMGFLLHFTLWPVHGRVLLWARQGTARDCGLCNAVPKLPVLADNCTPPANSPTSPVVLALC